MADANDVAQIRAFNRFYTKVLGLLDEGLYDTPHSLAEARLIYELARPEVTTAAQVAATLDMDRGQMSRLVARLSDQGLVAMLPRAGDKRSVPLALTAEGRAVAERLAELSANAVATTLLDPLTPLEQRDLVGAMRRMMALLAEPEAESLVLRGARSGDIGWLIHRQALLYAIEYGWNREFEVLIARLYAEYEATPDSPPKMLWVAEAEGEVAGSVYVLPAAVSEGEGIAQLRMLYVEPMFRGRGIGSKLVSEAIRFAREAGYRRMILWTQDCLGSARRIYQGAGFTLLREDRHHSFGVDLNGQYWAMDLR